MMHGLLASSLAILVPAAFWAGMQNALAGGGSFVTFPALLLSGLDPRTANITSTIALFPGQVATGWVVRHDADGIGAVPFRVLFALSLCGGTLGALLLLATPATVFARLVPWLVLFATAVFAYGGFVRRKDRIGTARPGWVVLWQGLIAVYGGYFGGGIGILMLAVLTMAGMGVRKAGASKNVLAAAMNASAVAVFLLDGRVAWLQAGAMAAGSIFGGIAGGAVLRRVPERLLRGAVVVIGMLLTVGLFLRRP